MTRGRLLAFALLALISGRAQAQCCGAGNPVGGAANVGAVIERGNANLVARASYSLADRTFSGSERTDPLFLDTAGFYQFGLNYLRGLSGRFSAELDAAFFHSTLDGSGIHPDYRTNYGINHAAALLYFNLYRNLRWEVTTGVGVQYETPAQKQTYRGSFISNTIRPKAAVPDFLHSLFVYRRFPKHGLTFFLANRIEWKGRDTDGYEYGNAFLTQVFASRHLGLRWDVILQVRSEIRESDERSGSIVGLTGSRKLFVLPQIAYTAGRTITITSLLELPIYQHVNGIQLGSTAALGLAIIKRFEPSGLLDL